MAARPVPVPVLARARRAALALAACLAGSAFAADAPREPREVRDPHYGDAVFHVFQDHAFTAVTTLMASQHFNRVSHHADEAEVLRGGMLLAYGLTQEAGDIFARLIERGATPAVRDRAWFFLAKIRYQRGLGEEAEAALARVEGTLPPALEEERVLLAANLLMARGAHVEAARVLDAPAVRDGRAPGARYVRYNLGVALLRAGEVARGTQVLDELGRQGAENEEQRALRDRANLAIGFTALGESRPKDARTYLERVRLQGLAANKALLGFGWAADALKDRKLALVPWAELAGRDLGDSAVLEAQIAVPYAYAELGAWQQSLAGYELAIARYGREATALRESIAVLRRGTLVDALVEQNPGDEMGWFWRIETLPKEMPHARHLTQVLAQHGFQEALKNVRDLRFLQKNLDDWRERLVVFGDMLATRRKAFAERLPPVAARPWQARVEALSTARTGLLRDLEAGAAAGDGVAFADASQQALLDRLASARAALATLRDGARSAGGDDARELEGEVDRAANRLRLAAGVLSWQLAQSANDRERATRRELAAVDAGLADVARRDAALAAAQASEPQRFAAFEARIAALDPRLAALAPRVAALAREQRTVAQEIAVAELERQLERLQGYETQARFALAQLYDRAYARNAEPEAGRATR